MSVLAAVSAGAAVALLVKPSRDARVRRLWRRPRAEREAPPLPVLAGAFAGVLAVLYFDGFLRLPLAAGIGLGVWHLVKRAEKADTEEDPLVTAAMPVFVDLVVAGLRAGRPPTQAVQAASEAVGAPLSDVVRARLSFDGDWRLLATHRSTGRLGRALQRSAYSGAPVIDTVARVAEEMRRDARSRAEDRARRVAVQTVGPLGACFLPAFLIVGVLPTIFSAFADLAW